MRVGQTLALPAGAARHVQVLRLQPGQPVRLFNGIPVDGEFGEFVAHISRMGRQSVDVQLSAFEVLNRPARRVVHLVLGMPANERMDWLIEKATELGVTSIQPLVTERSVLRLKGDRAKRKQQHWQSVAEAACEQCGATQLPVIHPICKFPDWLTREPAAQGLRRMLSLHAANIGLGHSLVDSATDAAVYLLSGPEGGLSPAEEAAATDSGFLAVNLGGRVLRAETAAIAALSALVLP